jgi:Catalase
MRKLKPPERRIALPASTQPNRRCLSSKLTAVVASVGGAASSYGGMHMRTFLLFFGTTLSMILSAHAEEPIFERVSPGEEARHIHYGKRFQEIQQELASGGDVHRGLHAKTHGCPVAQLVVNGNLAPEDAQGIFKAGARYSALTRFSNGSTKIQDDGERDFRGLALRIFNVKGERFQDLLLTNAPSHFARNSTEMMEFFEAAHAGGLYLLKYFVFHPTKAAKIISDSSRPVSSLLTERYWSRVPFLHGNRAVKYYAHPCSGYAKRRPDDPPANYLRDNLKNHLRDNAACFHIMAQYYMNEELTPIEDATVEWKTDNAPMVSLAMLTLPTQVFDTPEQKEVCEKLSFNPWNGLKAHRPLGEMSRARKVLYLLSQATRNGDAP